MTSIKRAAGSAFPAIDLPVLGGGRRSLATARDGFDWMLTIVYRGKHCPLCTAYLKELNGALADLTALGVDVLAVSADSQARASAHMADVAPEFDVAYGLTVAQMQELGLYISGPGNGTDVEGPFAEPGLFVINDAGTLQIVDISNVPFARPELARIVKGIGFLKGRTGDAPINGTHA
ncbi:peroxiredoxin [Rhodobium orientis]|uniref:Thioredoxin peroxidase n=1 Tax=Rhodobium orientis TaxID=34017 RepID=A0A327JM72_9HYPH|nr:redoxin domain-containing protein [Rhodobium orientis]MBB4305019.1 peroxiredoxin [Rhodobium orientis]MBK5948774.1 thioredoxin peroxidase [Rhodobium orientis]RAI26463.1 thioredoxin peroxidase [Rhodobium orientis]